MIARRMAPGRLRDFAFLHWPIVDRDVLAPLLAEARDAELASSPVTISGSDRDAGAIAAARANAERAGVAGDIDFAVRPLSAMGPSDPPGLIATNPPYGIRVGEADRLRDLYAQLGNVARRTRPGGRLALLAADRQLERQIALRLAERFRTRNGGIPVHLVVADIGDSSSALRASG